MKVVIIVVVVVIIIVIVVLPIAIILVIVRIEAAFSRSNSAVVEGLSTVITCYAVNIAVAMVATDDYLLHYRFIIRVMMIFLSCQ